MHQVELITSFSKWRERAYEHMHGLDATRDDHSTFTARIEQKQTGNLKSLLIETAPHTSSRSMKDIKRKPSEHVFIALKLAGTAGFSLNDEEVPLETGDLVLIDTNRPIMSVDSSQPSKFISVHFERHYFDDLLSKMDIARNFVFKPDLPANRVLRSHLRSLHDNLLQLDANSANGFKSSTAEILRNCMLSNRTTDRKAKPNQLQEVQNMLMAGIRQPDLRISDIATELSLSERKIYRLFQDTGTTPSKWIEDRRLKLIANELLNRRNTRRSISEIAFSFGFNDISHFSRTFKRHFGVSPRNYIG